MADEYNIGKKGATFFIGYDNSVKPDDNTLVRSAESCGYAFDENGNLIVKDSSPEEIILESGGLIPEYNLSDINNSYSIIRKLFPVTINDDKDIGYYKDGNNIYYNTH